MRASILICALVSATTAIACSSGALAPDGGANASGAAGAQGAAGHAGGVPACARAALGGAATFPHRAQAAACPSTNMASTQTGAVSCTRDSECNPDGGGYPVEHCIAHVCTTDECLVDDDCASGGVCVCAKDAGVGLIKRYNRCAPATCRTDGDCGDGGLCAPKYGYCATTTSYQCRSTADTCCTNADCAGKGTSTSCEFTPAAGRWQCVVPTVACLG
jgi:hypothetical protein